jgi:hypothetical protein
MIFRALLLVYVNAVVNRSPGQPSGPVPDCRPDGLRRARPASTKVPDSAELTAAGEQTGSSQGSVPVACWAGGGQAQRGRLWICRGHAGVAGRKEGLGPEASRQGLTAAMTSYDHPCGMSCVLTRRQTHAHGRS